MIYLDASALVSMFMADRHAAAIRRSPRAERPVVGVSDVASAEFARPSPVGSGWLGSRPPKAAAC